MRIGFVHTSASLVERFRLDMSAQHPQVDTFHILNEGILQDVLRGEERASVYRRVVQQLLLAADNLTDLVVMTCSSTSPAVDVARQLSQVPILKIDDPMAAAAVHMGRRIAVLCTTTSTPGPCASLLRMHAATQGMEIMVETVVRPEAYTALFAGNKARHDAIVTEAAREVAGRADVLVLAQASLSHLQAALEDFGKPVLSSPPMLMAELSRRLAPERAGV